MEMDDMDLPAEGQGDEYNDAPVEEGQSSGKFDKLLSENSRKYKLSGMFKEWFLD